MRRLHYFKALRLCTPQWVNPNRISNPDIMTVFMASVPSYLGQLVLLALVTEVRL